MFDKNELKVISRALTSYRYELMQTKKVIEDDYLPGDERLLENIIDRMVNAANVDEKVQKELWKLIHGGGEINGK